MAQFIEGTRSDGGSVVHLSGEIDLAVVGDLLEMVLDCLARADDLQLDLGDVTFIDSSGLGVLVRVRNEAALQGKSLSLANVGRPTSRLLEITGLGEAFDIRSDET